MIITSKDIMPFYVILSIVAAVLAVHYFILFGLLDCKHFYEIVVFALFNNNINKVKTWRIILFQKSNLLLFFLSSGLATLCCRNFFKVLNSFISERIFQDLQD